MPHPKILEGEKKVIPHRLAPFLLAAVKIR
jgi:hypothetical protein